MKITKLILFSLLLTSTAFARAGGSDAGHSGGGGTFVKSAYSQRLIFWDLFEQSPRMQDNEAGDRIALSAAGEGARGEWIDYRKFRSYAFLQSRLAAWSRRLPLFSQVMRENGEHRDLLFIGTSLSIQKIAEIDVPARAAAYGGLAVPGAYFDYGNGRLYVDVKVWNQAGLQSQAAMLLHERLREVQIRYGLSNQLLQRIVYFVVMWQPEHVDPNGAGGPWPFDDHVFDPARGTQGRVPDAWPVRESRSDALPAAPREIAEAVEQGILGEHPLFQPPQSIPENPCRQGPGDWPSGGSDAGHSGGSGCEPKDR